MPSHTKKTFATLCNLATNGLAVYIKRGQVVLTGDLINDAIEPNKTFLEKRAVKKSKPAPKSKKEISAPGETTGSVSDQNLDSNPSAIIPNENQSFTESERQLKFLQTLKTQGEIEKIQLDLAKKRGEVIPSDLIKPVFIQHNQSIVTEFKNATDEMLRSFSKKKALSVNETAELKGEMVEIINNSMKKATLLTIKGIDNIVDEFAIKKGIGERNV